MKVLIVFLDQRTLDGWRALDSQMNPHSSIMLHDRENSYRMDEEGSRIDCRVIRDGQDVDDNLRGRSYDFVIFHDAWLRSMRSSGKADRLRSHIYALVLR